MIIETVDLVKLFGRLFALDGLNLRIPRGISGLIGPNGAGKTTTIHVLLGLLKADSGEAYVFGMDCWSQSFEIKRKVGVLLEDPVYPRNFTGERYIEFVARLRDVSRPELEVKEILRDVGLYWAKDRKIGGYSAGMLQRLGLARALIGEPELVILDEPTANLDPAGRMELLEKIKELHEDKGISFLISTHILPELERICDWVSIIRDGKIVEQGPLNELFKKYKPHTYEIEVSDPKMLVFRLNNLDFVENMLVKGNKVHCKVKNVEKFCKEIPNIISSLKLSLIRFQPVYGVLEEVYRNVIGVERSD